MREEEQAFLYILYTKSLKLLQNILNYPYFYEKFI